MNWSLEEKFPNGQLMELPVITDFLMYDDHQYREGLIRVTTPVLRWCHRFVILTITDVLERDLYSCVGSSLQVSPKGSPKRIHVPKNLQIRDENRSR